MSSIELDCSAEEWQVRLDLAALYRLFVRFGWSDLTYMHLCARLPNEPGHYLIHRYGLLFEEVSASNLLKVDFDGKALAGPNSYNRAGHVIHTSVLRARPEINFVLHSHTRAGVAVSAMKCGLLPISQQANVVLGTLAYHAYSPVDEDQEHCDRLVCDLGNKYLLIQHNHGLLACGRTAGEAFLYHYFLQCACEIQIDVMRSGTDIILPSTDHLAKLSEWGCGRSKPWGEKQWKGLLRVLERTEPSFKT